MFKTAGKSVNSADRDISSVKNDYNRWRLTFSAALYNYIVMERFGYGQMSSRQLDSTFAALADPTRRSILGRLAKGQASVAELAKPFEMSQPAISKHLKVLERAGLVSRGLDAQRRPRKLETAPLKEATDWLEKYRQFWDEAYNRLDSLLEDMKKVEKKRRK
jgi:DNA-binding transcriptional ArsR family regulator